MKNVLFITYDGLTDPLGQSQILPYMAGLSAKGYKITILSCEKAERLDKFATTIKQIVSTHNLTWEYISFTRKPPILAKMFDYQRLLYTARKIVKQQQINLVHCRSYVAADIGLKLKQQFGCKMVFDMRGFWADERKDSGAWNVEKPLFRYLYNKYKAKERQFILNADYIISLTNAAKQEIKHWDYVQTHQLKIATIPCCADMRHFSLGSLDAKQHSRELLGIAAEALVVSYLGSIGAWYMLDEMLQLFICLLDKYTNAVFLFITHSDPQLIYAKLAQFEIGQERVIIRSASRDEVPVFLKASDLNVSFIRRVYSKIASSPTKNAEVLATGVPIILNSGIGDADEIAAAGVAVAINDFSTNEYKQVVDKIPALLLLNPQQIREFVATNYDLTHAVAIYNDVYTEVLG